MQDEEKKTNELRKEAEEAVDHAKKSVIARFEERVKAVGTGWLVAGFSALSLLAWGQDSLPAVLSFVPFGSVVLNWLTDSTMWNFDESLLGIPWFVMGVELIRRARLWFGDGDPRRLFVRSIDAVIAAYVSVKNKVTRREDPAPHPGE